MAASRLLSLLPLVLMCALLVGGCDDGQERIAIGDETFVMEIAATDESRTHGMSGRESFPEGGGMLFIFPDVAHRSFWMKDCLMDIDVIFVDARGIVTAVHRMPMEPPRRSDETVAAYEARLPNYRSNYPAQFAIELPAGSIDRLGVRVEDRIPLDLDRLKAMAR